MRTRNIIITTIWLLSYVAANGQTVTGGHEPLLHWRCAAGNAQLNHNAATTEPLRFDSLPSAMEYSMIVVYKPVADTEATVWRMASAGRASRVLTTERIISDTSAIRYADMHDSKPAVHTLRQTLFGATVSPMSLTVGDGNVKVAEVFYYGRRMGNAELRKVQSALALRYGITLGPVDYIDGGGRRIWEYSQGGRYHHRVTGVGVDIRTGLDQHCSRSEMAGALLTIGTDSLADDMYMIAGDDDAALVFDTIGDTVVMEEYQMLRRKWKIKATGTGTRSFVLAFDTRSLPRPVDSLVLIVDGQVCLPERVGGDSAVFRDVVFPSDSCLFTLGRGSVLWRRARSNAKRGVQGGETGGSHRQCDETVDGSNAIERQTVNLYPNPTNGHYTLEVNGAEHVQVTIYNVQGAVERSCTATGSGSHRFEGDLPTGKVYYATVTTENGSQTLKLIVK